MNALAADPELRLAIIDWVMPKCDGIEVCRQIRSGPAEPYVYVVLLTAKDDKADIIQGLDAGRRRLSGETLQPFGVEGALAGWPTRD